MRSKHYKTTASTYQVGDCVEYWTILDYLGVYDSKSHYRCKCICGEIRILDQKQLKTRHPSSCGCRRWPKKECPICNKEFIPKSSNQVTCGDPSCRAAHKGLRNKRKVTGLLLLDEKVCPVCGEHFRSNNGMKKYCSAKCRNVQKTKNLKNLAKDSDKGIYTMKDVRPSRCSEIEAQARKVGLHYQDIQIAETLKLYGHVRLEDD